MKLLPKLTLMAIGISAVPLAIAGYSSYRLGELAVRSQIDESQLQFARQVAQHVGGEVGHLLGILRGESRVLDLLRTGDEPPRPEVVTGFLRTTYYQSQAFCAVALYDEHGKALAPPVYLDHPEEHEAFKGHEVMRASDVETLGLMAPLGDALARNSGVGPVFLGGPEHTPHVVLAVAFNQSSAGGARRVLAAEVTLRDIAAQVEALATADSEVKLVDGRGRLIALTRARQHGGVLTPQPMPSVREGELPASETIGDYVTPAGRVMGAYAPSTPYPFGVVNEKTVSAALAPVNRIRGATALWILVSGVVGAIVASVVARRLAGRVGELAAGARQVAAGDLEVRLEIASSDEIGDLAATFNAMAESLELARTEILKQKDEILRWNQGLEARVDEKTRELRQAHDLLLRSRSLAALGELGSGVAHEINNPLAGVLGLAQLLLTDLPGNHPARAMIQDIEGQALRIRKIVFNLLRFAQRQAGEDFRAVELPRVLDDAVELCGPSDLAAAGIQIVRRYSAQIAVVRGSATQLQEAFIQLIQNARGAMRAGGTLTLETSLPDEKLVRVAIGDTGRGIDAAHLPRIFDPFFTTKEEWSGVGLGLSLVHKTVEDHAGSVQVQSEPGRGTTFWLTFPAHLGNAPTSRDLP